MTRRGLLKIFGLGAGSAALSTASTAMNAGSAVQGMPGAGSTALYGMPHMDRVSQLATSARDFAEFWNNDLVQERIKNELKHRPVTLDPDLALMRLPLPTLVRIQKGRIFKREMENTRYRFGLFKNNETRYI